MESIEIPGEIGFLHGVQFFQITLCFIAPELEESVATCIQRADSSVRDCLQLRS